MNKAIAIILLIACTLASVLIVVLAPDAFENGGYLHHACIHLGTIIVTLSGAFAIVSFLQE